MARDWAYINKCLEELKQLFYEASKIDIRNTTDVYYYEFMIKIAIEDIENEVKEKGIS